MSSISQTIFFLALLLFVASPLLANAEDSRYASPLERQMAKDAERIRLEELKRQPNQNVTISAQKKELTTAPSQTQVAASSQTQATNSAQTQTQPQTEAQTSDSFWDYQPNNIVDGLVYFTICIAACPFVFIYALCNPDNYKSDQEKSESGNEEKTK